MVLETNFKCFVLSEDDKEKEKYRFVQFQPDLIIDLEFMCETNEKFEETGFEASRCENPDEFKRTRPTSIYNQYKHPIKPPKRKKGRDTNPILYNDDMMNWLANEWYANNKRNPTRSQILKGVINADKKQMHKLFPKY